MGQNQASRYAAKYDSHRVPDTKVVILLVTLIIERHRCYEDDILDVYCHSTRVLHNIVHSSTVTEIDDLVEVLRPSPA